MTELANIQKWLTSIIIKPGTLNEKITLADEYYKIDNQKLIRQSLRQNSTQKIEIYARGYLLRLLECMQAEFPTLHHLLGEDLFNTFVKAYLVQRPPSSPDLYDLGKNFAAFLKASQPPDQSQNEMIDLPVELAVLERALAEVSRLKGLEDKSYSPPVGDHLPYYLFDNSSIRTSPCLILLQLKYQMVDYIKAVQQQKECDVPHSENSYVAISRNKYRINFQEIEHWQWHFLEQLKLSGNYQDAVLKTANQCNIQHHSLMADLLLWFPVAINLGYIYKDL